MTYLEFMRGTLGPNWVIARRTPRILAKYGEDVVCISKQRMRALDKEFRRMYGDPYDKVRAKMYEALLVAKSFLTNELQFDGIDPDEARAVLHTITAAVAAEQERP